ncbi:phage antirepressor N-terminal domain-containing protein [Streptomyces gilvifuscus]|uniref:Phage antirepressor N-terminal domain-containing protein n=1 Tax=Streptomyces gilvifuscus TaxID=1550617 RepID=A0ABT5FLG6_9ACTN|nr:phage antirepressor N-terminal domain-containing protein [Streptomyces gilvifuscus]MDC2953359.1 phage antirepressor N-terminal domain-containing protein [Streptomyces gilvifuscus]
MTTVAPLSPPATVQLSTGSLLSVRGEDGQTQVVFKYAVESIGLDYSSQLKRLRRQPWASVVITTMQLPGDAQSRDFVTVPEDTFIMWAATLQASRVSPELRPMLVAFQTESKKALHAYWTEGVAFRREGETRKVTARRMTPTLLRQIYFSDVPEGRFFQHLYDNGYLLDQRKTRRDGNGNLTKDGYRHGHPRAGKGDRYFQLPEDMWVDANGRPRGRAVVRPDRVQELVEQLIEEGLAHNPSITRGTERRAISAGNVHDVEFRRGA